MLPGEGLGILQCHKALKLLLLQSFSKHKPSFCQAWLFIGGVYIYSSLWLEAVLQPVDLFVFVRASFMPEGWKDATSLRPALLSLHSVPLAVLSHSLYSAGAGTTCHLVCVASVYTGITRNWATFGHLSVTFNNLLCISTHSFVILSIFCSATGFNKKPFHWFSLF